MLQRLAGGSTLRVVLTGIAEALEALLPGDRCVILLFDKRAGLLRPGAAPSMSPRWHATLGTVEPGPRSGTCGRAVLERKQVIAPDVAHDPRYSADLQRAAVSEGVRSSWSTPITGGDGDVTGTFALYSDFAEEPDGRQSLLVERCTNLTALAIEHARLYGELAESEARFRRAFDANIIGMALVDTERRLQRVNPALCQILRVTEKDLLQADLGSLLTAPDDPRLLETLRLTDSGARDGALLEWPGMRPDGSAYPAVISISALRDGDGSPAGYCVHFMDQTEKRAAEAERQGRREAEVARRTAEAASQAKSWFLSGLAHEVYAPMSGIVGFAELLDTLDLTTERRRYAQQRIGEAARHVISLLDDVLDIAKIEGGALQLEKQNVDLPALLGEVTGLLEPIATRRGVEIVCRPPAGTPTVLADRRRIRQVLFNVIGNAVKYNRQDGLVTASLRREGDVVVLEVTDQGPGFADHAIARIFRPFDRLGAERTQVQGTGLGLPLSKALIDAMGGDLRLYRAPDSGAVVQIRLPAA